MWLQILLFIFLASSSAKDEDGLRLYLYGAEPGKSAYMPISAFLALPPGMMREANAYGVFDSTGVACPADLHPTCRHSDGSIRYLAIRIFSGPRKQKPWVYLRNRLSGPPAIEKIVCRKPGGEIPLEVDTGPLRVAFSSQGKSSLHGMWLWGEPVLALEDGMFGRVLLGNESFRSVPSRLITLDEGCAASRVRVQSRTRSPSSIAGPDCEIQFTFYPGSAFVQCEVGFTADRMEGYSNGIFLYLRPASSLSQSRVLIFSEATGLHNRPASYSPPVSLEAGNGGLLCREKGRTAPFLESDDAGLFLYGEKGGLGVYLPMFRPLHPWSVECNRSNEIRISLFSQAFLWKRGFVCERRFLLEATKDRSLPALPPRQGALSGATAFGLPEESAFSDYPFAPHGDPAIQDPGFRLLRKVTLLLADRMDAEKKVWDGYRDTGDYRMEYGQFANCEFDPVYGYLKRFLLFRRFEDRIDAEVTLRHWLLFDRAGSSDTRALPGLPWMHGDDHASGQVELGHMWIDGVLLYYLMTHDLECREAALCVGNYMSACLLDEDTSIRERCVSWSLMALAALVDAGFSEFEKAMDRYAGLLQEKQADEGYFQFDRIAEEGIDFHSCSPWITSGITLEALYRHFALTGDPSSKRALLRGARWLKTDAWDRRKGEWYSRILYGRNAKGKRIMKTSSRHVRGGDLSLVALGLARAGCVASDRALLKKARRALLKGLRQIESIEQEYPGRTFSLVMRSAPDVLLATLGVGN